LVKIDKIKPRRERGYKWLWCLWSTTRAGVGEGLNYFVLGLR